MSSFASSQDSQQRQLCSFLWTLLLRSCDLAGTQQRPTLLKAANDPNTLNALCCQTNPLSRALEPKAGLGTVSASQGAVGKTSSELRVYKVLGKQDRRAFLYALCSAEDDDGLPKKLDEEDAEVTCFRLDAFCQQYGWPFVPEDLPSPPKFGVVHTQGERLSIAGMHQKLQKEFSTKELRDTMTFVRNTVDDVVKDMEGHTDSATGVVHREGLYGPFQLKAINSVDEDAAKKFVKAQLRCFAADYLYHPSEAERMRAPSLARPDEPHTTKAKTTRDVLDEQRRTWSFIFQRFATMWKLGHFTEELFEGIDFPGTGRVITFMEYCEPLDEANFRLVIKQNMTRTKPGVDGPAKIRWEKEEKAWGGSRPEVYKFLRAWLQYKDDMEAAAVPSSSSTALGDGVPSGSAAPDNQGQPNNQTGQGSPPDQPHAPVGGSPPDARAASPGPRAGAALDPGSHPGDLSTGPDNKGTPPKQPHPPVAPLALPGVEAADVEAAAKPGRRVANAPTEIQYGGRPRAPLKTRVIPYVTKGGTLKGSDGVKGTLIEGPSKITTDKSALSPESRGLAPIPGHGPEDPLTRWLFALVLVVLMVEAYRLLSWLYTKAQ